MNNGWLATIAWIAALSSAFAAEPVSLESRLELFADEFLIEKLAGDARLHLHKPAPGDIVFVTDRPWEGNTSAYFTIFQDGELYRMYYRGSHFDEKTRKATHREVACYAESRDGIRWTRPDLGLVEFDGSKQNNIVWNGVGSHNFTPFKDSNPACPADARYKALASGDRGLCAFQSADGIHWRLIREEPVITKGAFDSQNLAFWDAASGQYRDYHRFFQNGVRDIMTATSKDFVQWTEPQPLEYSGAPREHLYTNAIRPYDREPHLLIGFPTRFLPKTEQVEPTFMISRDGRTFRRWTEAVIPVTAPQDRDGNRSNYMTWGLVRLPGAANECSVYATEAYYRGPASRVRRFTYRTDGFVSLHAESKGGELLTKPLRFAGDHLVLNYRTSPQGQLRVEIQDANGKPLEGFALGDCPPLGGDSVEHVVAWNRGSDLGRLAGQPVRVRFELRESDLFSMRFSPKTKAADKAATPAAQPLAIRIASFTVAPAHTPQAIVMIKNLDASPYDGIVSIRGPQGWKFDPAEHKAVLAPGETKRLAFTIHRGTIVEANSYAMEVAASGAATVTHRQNVVCASAPNFKPQIDGKTDEWKDAIPATFTSGGKKTVISTYWNRRQFAILAAVEENRLVAYSGDGGPGEFDALQVAISPDDKPTSTSSDDPARRYEFLFVPTADGKGKCFQLAQPEAKLAEAEKTRPLATLAFDAAEVAVSRKDGVTYYECMVPFKAIGEIRPSEGREFCLSLLVHDPDGTGVRDWGEAAGLWPWERNRRAWSRWQGAEWPNDPPFDNKTSWGLCSSKY